MQLQRDLVDSAHLCGCHLMGGQQGVPHACCLEACHVTCPVKFGGVRGALVGRQVQIGSRVISLQNMDMLSGATRRKQRYWQSSSCCSILRGIEGALQGDPWCTVPLSSLLGTGGVLPVS